MSKASFPCVQTAPRQRGAVWLAAQFDVHITHWEGFVNYEISAVFPPFKQPQKGHNSSANQSLNFHVWQEIKRPTICPDNSILFWPNLSNKRSELKAEKYKHPSTCVQQHIISISPWQHFWFLWRLFFFLTSYNKKLLTLASATWRQQRFWMSPILRAG